MTKYHSTKLDGPWTEGFSLDMYSISSTYLGDDDGGRPTFETTYSEVGQLLHDLKYRQNFSMVAPLVRVAVHRLGKWKPPISAVVSVPPTKSRRHQPLEALAKGVAKGVSLPYLPKVIRKRPGAAEMKSVDDPGERTALLEHAFVVEEGGVSGQSVLLVDDMYRSGSTLAVVTKALLERGEAEDVYVLAFAHTRSKR